MNFQPPDLPDHGNCPTCKTSIHQDELRGDQCIECEPEDCAHSHANKLGCPECGLDFGSNAELVRALEMLILFTKPNRFNAAALANAYRALNSTKALTGESK